MFGRHPPVLHAKFAEKAISASLPGPRNLLGKLTKYLRPRASLEHRMVGKVGDKRRRREIKSLILYSAAG